MRLSRWQGLNVRDQCSKFGFPPVPWHRKSSDDITLEQGFGSEEMSKSELNISRPLILKGEW
jgi:hypothetical protein